MQLRLVQVNNEEEIEATVDQAEEEQEEQDQGMV
jgi:hypothetical protein